MFTLADLECSRKLLIDASEAAIGENCHHVPRDKLAATSLLMIASQHPQTAQRLTPRALSSCTTPFTSSRSSGISASVVLKNTLAIAT